MNIAIVILIAVFVGTEANSNVPDHHVWDVPCNMLDTKCVCKNQTKHAGKEIYLRNGTHNVHDLRAACGLI